MGSACPGGRPWAHASGGLDTCAVPPGCCLVLLSLVYKVVGETATSGLCPASTSGVPGWPSESTPMAERPRAGSCPRPAGRRDGAEGVRLLRLRQEAGAGWGPRSRGPAQWSLPFSSGPMFSTLSLDTLPAYLCLRLFCEAWLSFPVSVFRLAAGGKLQCSQASARGSVTTEGMGGRASEGRAACAHG